MRSRHRIALDILNIARLVLASNENYGYYSIDFDGKTRTFTVYFILKDGITESEALKNAKACCYEINSKLEHDKLVEVTHLQNEHKSFYFTIVVEKEDDEEDEKKASVSFDDNLRVAISLGGGDSDDEDSDDDSDDDSGDDDTDDDSDEDSGDDDSKKENALSDEDKKKFEKIKKTISDICKKHNWDTDK